MNRKGGNYEWVCRLLLLGAFILNAVPHSVNGVSGRSFPTPSASPPGRGLSSPLANVRWGTLNVVVRYLLVCPLRESHIRSVPDVFVLGVGCLYIAVVLSQTFGPLLSM